MTSIPDTESSGQAIGTLIRIREVPGSNQGSETGYPDMLFVVFLSPSRQVSE
jgi:hypothetical protein